MKKWNFLVQVSLLAIISIYQTMTYAAKPLFKVSFIQNNVGNDGYMTIRTTTPNFVYPYAGIQFNSDDIVMNQGCIKNPVNGWCLFPVSDTAPNVLQVSLPNKSLMRSQLTINMALNAKGKNPVSVQQMTVSTQSPGRVIGYLYGWETPPQASAIKAAGYTHVLITFGLFSTTSPGEINIQAISGFDLKSYVQSLHQNGLQALLSIGGASTSIPDTIVNFDQAVSMASSPQAFEQTFMSSMNSLVATYDFDGFDFDIESGLNGAQSFVNPGEGCSNDTYDSKCDIYYLSTIINGFHTQYPDTMLTLAPQIANIAATQQFDSVWGNYASLVMQTYGSLEWVAFQNYNAGCAYGIDLICYPTGSNTLTSTADPAVAFSTDLLENWPATTSSGQITGFQNYTSFLNPSQVVIGYVVNNSSGNSDGSPSVNPYLSVAKDAIQCLRSHEKCATYTPPRTYPGIGGVFAWSINYDASNNYQFAKSLYPCVVQGNCS